MIRVVAFGTPAPKGSPQVVTHGKGGVPLKSPLVVADSPALKRWHRAVSGAALVECMGRPRPLLADRALLVGAEFRLARPASVTERKRPMPSVKPDLDKLVRASLDPLQGLVFDEDSRIVVTVAHKRYALPGEAPGATLLVAELGEAGALRKLVLALGASLGAATVQREIHELIS